MTDVAFYNTSFFVDKLLINNILIIIWFWYYLICFREDTKLRLNSLTWSKWLRLHDTEEHWSECSKRVMQGISFSLPSSSTKSLKFLGWLLLVSMWTHGRVHIRYLTRSLRSLVRYRCEHSKINSISPSVHVLFCLLYKQESAIP